MAVETFKFIKGNKIENAMSYRLMQFYNDQATGRDQYREIKMQNLIQPFDIPGALGTDGKPVPEYYPFYEVDVVDNFTRFSYTPIVRDSASGPDYYVKFKGTMTVTTDERVFTNVPFEGTRYFFNADEHTFKIQKKLSVITNVPEEDRGIYLHIITESDTEGFDYHKYMVYKLDSSQEVLSAEVEFDSNVPFQIGSAAGTFRHTTFIPIDCLTDDLNGYCVGMFDWHHDAWFPYYKICFYDENFAFLHGVGKAQINEIAPDSKFLTVQQVKDLGVNQAAKYVRFTSRSLKTGQGEDESPDNVSIGHIYFPLFHYPDSVFKHVNSLNASGTVLCVEAVGDGLFFTDSPLSEDVQYNRPKHIVDVPAHG